MNVLLKVYLCVSVFVGGDLCFGGENRLGGDTHLIHRPNLEKWKPPVAKVKVWESREVGVRNVIREGERKVLIEQCKAEKVESLSRKVRKVEVDVELERVLAGLDEEKAPVGYVEPIRVGVSSEVFKEGGRLFSRVRVAVGKDVCVVWSSMNFHYMQGVVEYMANGRRYYEGGGVSDGYLSASEAGCPVDDVALNGKGVGFVVVEGVKAGRAWTAVGDIHDLFEAERVVLVRAYGVYVENRKLAAAWHKANPPKPKDIKLQFWKREEGNLNR